MIKIQRFIVISLSVISLFSFLDSCEINSNKTVKKGKANEDLNKKNEKQIDTLKQDFKKQEITEKQDENEISFNDLFAFFQTWSVETHTIGIQKSAFKFKVKRIENDTEIITYVRNSPEARIKITAQHSKMDSKEFRCDFYTSSHSEYEAMIEEIDKKKFKPDRSKRSYNYRIGSYEGYTISAKGETKRNSTTLYYWIEIVHYQGKELSEPVLLEY
jgi:hypothetical protein